MGNILKQKSPRTTILEKTIYLLVPFVATAIVILMQYYTWGAIFSFSTSFVASSIVTAGVMMAYYFPSRTLFKDMFVARKRIQNKLFEYSVRSTLVYNGHLDEFDSFCDYEYEHRKMRFINVNLQIIKNLSYDDFVDKYKFSERLIRADKTLSKKQKMAMFKVVTLTKFIKRQDYSKVLPGTEFGTVFKRLKSSETKATRGNNVKKVASSIIMAVATISLIPTLNLNVTPMEILIQVLIRIAVGLWQVFSAMIVANKLINKTFFSELCEKNLFMDEFIEYKQLNAELIAIAKSASANKDEEDKPVFVEQIVQKNIIEQPVIKVEQPSVEVAKHEFEHDISC